MTDEEELNSKLNKLENTVAIWALQYVRERRQSSRSRRGSKARTKSSIPILSLEKINEAAEARNVPVFPTGVTGEGQPERLSDVMVTQALVVNIFLYELMKPAQNWPESSTQDFNSFHQNFKSMVHQLLSSTQPRSSRSTVQSPKRLRKEVVEEITDLILFGILESPKKYRYKSVYRKLTELGYSIFDICVDMARADPRCRFASLSDVRSFDTRQVEEYRGSTLDIDDESKGRKIYMLMFPPCIRSRLDTDFVDGTLDVVVKRGKGVAWEV